MTKDLEKDERGAMEEFLKNPLCPFRSHQQLWPAEKGFEAGWHARGEQVETRLQQVEVDCMALVEVKLDREKEIRERDRLLSIAQEEIVSLRDNLAEKDLIIKASEQHTQYWEDKCAE